jgi:hypothetical protein
MKALDCAVNDAALPAQNGWLAAFTFQIADRGPMILEG